MVKILSDDYMDDFDSTAWLDSVDDDVNVLSDLDGAGEVGAWNEHGQVKGFFDLYEDVAIYAEPTTIGINADYERESGKLNGIRKSQKRDARMRCYYANHDDQKAKKRAYNRAKYRKDIEASREKNRIRAAEWRAKKKAEKQ